MRRRKRWRTFSAAQPSSSGYVTFLRSPRRCCSSAGLSLAATRATIGAVGHSTSRSPKRRGFHPLTWLGGHEMAVLLALAGIVAGVWAFALLADEVLEGGTQAFDQKLLLAFRHSDT